MLRLEGRRSPGWLEAVRDTAEDRIQISQRSPFRDVVLHPSRLERHASRSHDQRLPIELNGADDDALGAHELSHTNHRRVGERRRRRHLQAFERLQPLRPGDRTRAARGQIVGEYH